MRKFLAVLVFVHQLGSAAAPPPKRSSDDRDDWYAWKRDTTRYEDGTLSYYVHTPPNYSPESGKHYPLLVILHWSYVSGSSYLHYWRPDGDAADVIIAAPNSRGRAAWVTGDGPNIRKMVRQVAAKYSVDPERVWLAGYSAGGVFVYHMLFKYPDVFNAVLALGGRIGRHWSEAPTDDAERSTRVCVFHGQWDRRYGKGSDREDVSRLESLGYDVTHVVVPRLGHWIPRDQGEAMIDCLAGGIWRHRLGRTATELPVRRARRAPTPRIGFPPPA